MKIQNSKFMAQNFRKGQAVIMVVIFFLFISLSLIFSTVSPALKNLKISHDLTKAKISYFFAESGVEDAIYRIKNNFPYSASYDFTADGMKSSMTISGSGNAKVIEAKGENNYNFRKVRVNLDIATTEADFFYGVQVGAGGIEMGQSSNITGSVYSNGSIMGANDAKVSGDAIVAGHSYESAQTRSIVCLQDQIVGKTNPQIDFAQSFVATTSAPLAKISLYIKKTGSPNNREIRITADSGGSPGSNDIAEGDLISSLVTTSYGWVDITFNSPPLLVAGNTYWIILDAAQDSNDYWKWCRDPDNGYASGVAKYSQDWNNDPWTQIVGDLNFKTYFGAGVSLIDGVIVKGDAKANSIANSKICGDAYYQSIDSGSLNFLNSPTSQTCGTPLTNGTAHPGASDPPLQNMPISQSNIDRWKADAQAGGQIAGNYSVTSNISLGPKEILGDLVMSSANKTLTVTGTIYVHGNMDIQNGSTIKCDPLYGVNSCIIVTDGWIHAENNGTFSGSGSTGSFLLILTTLACDGSFSTGCTHHNGAADVHNNATGVIFYAQNGKINLHNGVNVTEVTAYKISLDNNAVITYDQGLSNAKFSAGPTAGWAVSNWQEFK
ncbi:MAG: hypothetical protein HZC14_00865 [Candidatus Niyogibacteria bacterium]|nr:hypothetical protein [Candidatus Niyogibacteria bacterium]